MPNHNYSSITTQKMLIIQDDAEKNKRKKKSENIKKILVSEKERIDSKFRVKRESRKSKVLIFNIEAEAQCWNPLTADGLETLTRWNKMLSESQKYDVDEEDSFDKLFRRCNALE